MGWGGIIAGALGGGAQAVGQMADQQLDVNAKKDLAQHLADIDIAKQEAIARTSESIRREGVLYDTTGEGGVAKRSAAVAQTKEVGAAETGVMGERETTLAPIKAKTEGLLAGARATAEREATLAKGSDPAYLKAERALAMTRHFDDGAGLRQVQLKVANLELASKEKAQKLIDAYAAEKDPVKKAELIQEMTVRGLIKPGEYDTEKVIEEKTNPDGSTTKTERTQKRTPGTPDLPDTAAAAPCPEGTELRGKDGKMYVVQGGKPVLKATKPLPRDIGDVPGSTDTGRVTRGSDFLPDDRKAAMQR